jgi:hypothetical protein
MGNPKELNLKVNKRCLLFIAAAAWTFAGGMLLFKGFSFMNNISNNLWIKILSGIIGGLLFYFILFSKISRKHVSRIFSFKDEKNSVFSFFSVKSYFLMIVMISAGITLRKTGIVPPDYLSIVYITMGIPLLLSAFRFYYHAFYFNSRNKIG